MILHFRKLTVEDTILAKSKDIGMSIEDGLEKG
jgi:hypothetical protein